MRSSQKQKTPAEMMMPAGLRSTAFADPSLLFRKADFDTVRNHPAVPLPQRLAVMAEMIRYNTVTAVTQVRSGHLGASLSAIEAFTVLYHELMGPDVASLRGPDRDVFILSKGHAAPGLYATLASVGGISDESLFTFRKYRGLQGHVDISASGIDGNSGSLGMGISKAKGYAWASRERARRTTNGTCRRAFVMVGDGELQEGQNWEAVLSAGNEHSDNLYLIVDRNMVQTDREVSRISDISPLEDKLTAFGWAVVTVADGNNVSQLLAAFEKLGALHGKPKALISNTIKGKGVSFMEHPVALVAGKGFYKWHGGIPNEDEYALACSEILSRIGASNRFGLIMPKPATYPAPVPNPFKGDSLKPAFSRALMALAKKHPNLVVLDADLADDCGLAEFETDLHERFIEVGIGEQDMVSMAAGLALAGKLPVVNTYTAFLTSRANEQIFNAASEKRKVIYIGHLAGLLPAKPGKSHQGIRDISLLRSIPGLLLCAPCNAQELDALFHLLVEVAPGPGYLRLEHPGPRENVTLPASYKPEIGKGVILHGGQSSGHDGQHTGNDAAIITYGALMVSESLMAARELEKSGISVRVINLPWLNNIDAHWLVDALGPVNNIFCVENHASVGGQAEEIRRIIDAARAPPNEKTSRRTLVMGVDGFAQSGDNEDVLRHYGLDHASIAKQITVTLKAEVKR